MSACFPSHTRNARKAGFAICTEHQICTTKKTDIITHGHMFIQAKQITDQEFSVNICWRMIFIMLN